VLKTKAVVDTNITTDSWLVEKKTTQMAIFSFKNVALGKSEVHIYNWDTDILTAVTIGFDPDFETVVSDSAGDYFLMLN